MRQTTTGSGAPVSSVGPLERVLISAAGAVSHADGVEQLLALPDAELGRVLKRSIDWFRQATAGAVQQASGRERAHVVTPVAVVPVDAQASSAGAEGLTVPILDGLMAQALENRRMLLNRKALLSSGELQRAWGVSRQAVSAAGRAGRVFSVDVDGQTCYPAFFADGKLDRAVLGTVTRRLGRLPGWSKWDFFTAARASLGGVSPLQALRAGRIVEVERLAETVAEEALR